MNWLKKLFVAREKAAKTSASVAKERLKIIVSHEKRARQRPDFLPQLQKEIMAVISKYMKVDMSKVKVDFEKQDDRSAFELSVTLPELTTAKKKTKATAKFS
ncbi:MAG: cell division topological specificity factor MinE [Thiotrichales bacterium]|nr:MAG: cell division topological specificity factor MinE [Thiotrichales bacterium]